MAMPANCDNMKDPRTLIHLVVHQQATGYQFTPRIGQERWRRISLQIRGKPFKTKTRRDYLLSLEEKHCVNSDYFQVSERVPCAVLWSCGGQGPVCLLSLHSRDYALAKKK